MEVSRILAEIDAQISKLQQARELLSGSSSQSSAPAKKSVGRPRKDAAPAGAKQTVPATQGRKRNLSPEARKRIAEAQKRRWAERKSQG